MNHEVLIVLWRDPYIGLLQSIYNWGLYNPLYKLNNLGFGHCSLVFFHILVFLLASTKCQCDFFLYVYQLPSRISPKNKIRHPWKIPLIFERGFLFSQFPSWRCPSLGKKKQKNKTPLRNAVHNLRNHPKRSSSPWLGSSQSQWEWPRWSFSFSTGMNHGGITWQVPKQGWTAGGMEASPVVLQG